MDDLTDDEDRVSKTLKKEFLYQSSVHYPNNKSLVKQNVYLSKKGIPTRVEVVDKDNNVQIAMKFNKVEFGSKFDKNYFDLSSILNISKDKNLNDKKDVSTENNTSNDSVQNNTVDSNNNQSKNSSGGNSSSNDNNSASSNALENSSSNNNQGQGNVSDNSSTNANDESSSEKKTETTASIRDVVYPMYLPNNTYLVHQEKVTTEDGERLILTFGGDQSFVLVEEVSSLQDENVVIPVLGEFDFLTDVIGIIGNQSLSWNSNGIDYYLASDVIETSELLDIARSISVLPVSK